MSASSSRAPETKYGVFLSFRGEDTRDNFVSFLYDALCRQNINTFIDNELSRGDEISQALLDAIAESKISVIVFSKDYASSKWCLDELVKILECKRFYKQIVIPVFYHIDPSDVAKQMGSFEDAFFRHEARFKDKLYEVQRWRDALAEAAGLAGWSSLLIRREATLTDEIVKDIMKRLNLSPNNNNERKFRGETIKLGPWGGDGGSPWSFKAENGVITEILITYGPYSINSIRLRGTNGKYSDQFGGRGGNKNMRITLGHPEEYLTAISGTYNKTNPKATGAALFITSLSFHTNIMTYDVGPGTGTPFSCPFEGGVIVGFYGRAGSDIDCLGFYLKPSFQQ